MVRKGRRLRSLSGSVANIVFGSSLVLHSLGDSRARKKVIDENIGSR